MSQQPGNRQPARAPPGAFELHNELDLLGPAAPSIPHHNWAPPAAGGAPTHHHQQQQHAMGLGTGSSAPPPRHPTLDRLQSTPVRQSSLSASLGAGMLAGAAAEEQQHPVDAPSGQGAAAQGSSQKGSIGVHGADKHEPEDDHMRIVQVQTLGGEGVLTGWQLVLRQLGYRPRRAPGVFPSNELATSKYSLLTFLPCNLYDQFKRVANLYFLLLVCLQAIPGLSPVPWWGTLFPLAVVLTVNGVKEAADDYWRHKSDEEVNHREVVVLREDGNQRVQWKQIQVGDLIRVHNNEDVPADLALLSSSDPEGLCYVETANLDGETNLKRKDAYLPTARFNCAEDFSRAGYFTVEAEAPNPRLYSFEGAIARWDIPPTLGLGIRSGARGRVMAGSPGRALRQGAGVGPDGTIGTYTAPFNEQVGFLGRDPLNADNLLLRGCTMRKTEWVIGVVVFTGADTKVVRNMLPAPRKVTQLERAMNRVVMAVLVGLGALALLLGINSMVWEVRHNPYDRDWYLGMQTAYPELPPGLGAFLVQVVRFTILMAQAVPISLYVSLEMVKVLQCKLLFDKDLAMYHLLEDVPFTSRTTTLNEELGQVSYVLSDKTGTLTQNVMGFVWASIGGKLYGQGPSIHAVPADLKGTSPADLVTAPDGVQFPLYTPHTLVLDAELRGMVRMGAAGVDVGGGKAASAAVFGRDAALDFALALALCNTVTPTATEDGQLLYQAASPDEEALVTGAAYLGIKLLGRPAGGMEVEVAGRVHRFELLAVLEFNSDRKRMSVVVKDPSGATRLLTKGADNVVLARLAPGASHLADVEAHLAEMSGAGFRTLVLGYKDLAPADFEAWAAGYKAACAAMTDREAAVAACCEDMERGLSLLGATAVEDKLQEGVPEAIASLKEAGVAVWVLTGDKMETAISIGHTCRLLNMQMNVLKVKESDLRQPGSTGGGALDPLSPSGAAAPPPSAASGPPPVSAGLASRLMLFMRSSSTGGAGAGSHGGAAAAGLYSPRSGGSSSAVQGFGSDDTPGRALRRMLATARVCGGGGAHSMAAGTGLVIDGGALVLALQPAFEDLFLQLCRACNAVICCRVSPMQKAQVTRLLKKKAGAVTLAIGDGANDVSMIQAAHIGVGISGREGRAAVQAADYAFGQFRFLVRLLLVHGRYSYLRCREVVLYAFYKNVAYVSCYVYYAFYSGFSAQSIFFSLYIATFNALWSAFPTLAYGVFDQELPPATLLAYPALYAETARQNRWDFLKAWLLWMGLGLWHGICCFVIPVRVLSGVNDAGRHTNVYGMGTAIMTAVVITVTLRVAIRTNYWTMFNGIAIGAPLALWMPFLLLLGGLCGSVTGLAPLCGLLREVLGTAGFWLAAVLLAPAASLLADFIIAQFQRLLAPRNSQILQEYESRLRRQAAAAAASGLQGGLPPTDAASAAAAAAAAAAGGVGGVATDLEMQQQVPLAEVALGRAPSVAPVPAAAAAAGMMPSVASGGSAGSGVGLLRGMTLPPSRPMGLGADRLGAAPHMLRTSSTAWGMGGIGMGYDTSFGGVGGSGATLGGFASMEWSPSYVVAGPSALAASHTKRQAAMPLQRGMQSAGGGMYGGRGVGGPGSGDSTALLPQQLQAAATARGRRHQQHQHTLQMAGLPSGGGGGGGGGGAAGGGGGTQVTAIGGGSSPSASGLRSRGSSPLQSTDASGSSMQPAAEPLVGEEEQQAGGLPVSSNAGGRAGRPRSPLGRGRPRSPAPPPRPPEPSQYVPPRADDALL